MSKIPFDKIADKVRQLDDALDAVSDHIGALWLAGRGAASLVPDEGGAIAETISGIYARDDSLEQARKVQADLEAIVKGVLAP